MRPTCLFYTHISSSHEPVTSLPLPAYAWLPIISLSSLRTIFPSDSGYLTSFHIARDITSYDEPKVAYVHSLSSSPFFLNAEYLTNSVHIHSFRVQNNLSHDNAISTSVISTVYHAIHIVRCCTSSYKLTPRGSNLLMKRFLNLSWPITHVVLSRTTSFASITYLHPNRLSRLRKVAFEPAFHLSNTLTLLNRHLSRSYLNLNSGTLAKQYLLTSSATLITWT